MMTTTELFIAHQIILKVASRCNLFCDYCHWFRDLEVYQQPKFMLPEVESAFLLRLRRYLIKYRIGELSLVFHGGEPLLFGRKRYTGFIQKVRELESDLDVQIKLAMTTNGALIDDAWADFLVAHGISVTISLDGPKALHDQHRKDLLGNGSFDQVMAGMEQLRRRGGTPGILTVANLDFPPETLFDFFFHTLGINQFDVLIPNFTHEDRTQGRVRSIAPFYIRLFDLWYDTYAEQGVTIRFLEALSKAVLGIPSGMQGIGQSALATLEILPDGAIEPHDVLRIGGNQNVNTGLNVRHHELDDVFTNPVWMGAFNASQNPCQTCIDCEYVDACGGGDVMHRYSDANQYDNPSVYCDDLQHIIQHAFDRILADLVPRYADPITAETSENPSE